MSVDTKPVKKWGEWSYVTREMLRDIDHDVLESGLFASATRRCRKQGGAVLDGSHRLAIIDPQLEPLVPYGIDETPPNVVIALVTLRYVERER